MLLRWRLGTGWTDGVSNPGRRNKCFSPPKRPYWLWGHPASYYNGTGVNSREKSGRGVMTTTHLHLAPRMRMSGAIPVLQLYAFMACIKTTLTFFAHFCAELWQSHYFTQSLNSIISHAALKISDVQPTTLQCYVWSLLHTNGMRSVKNGVKCTFAIFRHSDYVPYYSKSVHLH